MEAGFQVLVERGFNPRAALLEVYGSGEMGKMLLDGASYGLDRVITLQGSPTCQVGYHRWRGQTMPAAITALASRILDQIESGEFATYLRADASQGYASVSERAEACEERAMNRFHRDVRSVFHFPSEDVEDLYQAHTVPEVR